MWFELEDVNNIGKFTLTSKTFVIIFSFLLIFTVGITFPMIMPVPVPTDGGRMGSLASPIGSAVSALGWLSGMAKIPSWRSDSMAWQVAKATMDQS